MEKNLPLKGTPVDQVQPTPPVNEVAPSQTDPDPAAPADLDVVSEQETRFGELSELLVDVGSYVEAGYRRLQAEADDDTDPPETSTLGQCSVDVELAEALEQQASDLLAKEIITNGDVARLEELLDDMEKRIEEATPAGFTPLPSVD